MTYKQYFLFIIKCEDKNDYRKNFQNIIKTYC